jgi:hypothetical protein
MTVVKADPGQRRKFEVTPMAYKIRVLFLTFFISTAAYSAHATLSPFPKVEQLSLVYLNSRETNETVLKIALGGIYARGFRRITIPYLGCQPSINSNEVGGCEVVPGSNFVLQAKIAKSVGLRVSFIPIVATPGGEWRGFFKPTNMARWFETYGAWIKKVGREATDLGMTELVVASEFSEFIYRDTARWSALLRTIKTEAFRGPLIITVNWDHPEFKFWPDADAFGISSYFPLQKPFRFNRSIDEQAIKNRDAMKKMALKAGKPLYIVEFGFPSLTTAAQKPWHYTVPPEVPVQDLKLQADCYDAYLKAWVGDTEVIGFNAWSTSIPEHPSSATGFEVLGKPAEEVLKKYLQ